MMSQDWIQCSTESVDAVFLLQSDIWALWNEAYRITWLNVNLLTVKSRKLRKNRGVARPFFSSPPLSVATKNKPRKPAAGLSKIGCFDGCCHQVAFPRWRFCFSAITFYSEIIIKTNGPRLSPPTERATESEWCTHWHCLLNLGWRKRTNLPLLGLARSTVLLSHAMFVPTFWC